MTLQIMDPIHMSSSANMVTCEEMCLVVGQRTEGHGDVHPPPTTYPTHTAQDHQATEGEH
eukprot:12423931-Karenia_brevis.AAC.1